MFPRNKEDQDLSSSNRFLQFNLIKESEFFENEEIVQKLINDYISFKVEEAKKQGARDLLNAIESDLKRTIRDYISLINKIVDFVFEASNKEFVDKDFKIIQTRTKFDMFNQQIKILFITDSDLDIELLFSDLLSKTERWVFETDNYLAQLSFINQRDLELNMIAINQDYPSRRKEKSGV